MISIIICTYNPKPVFLERTLNSILSQNFKDFEVIIVDNNSKSPVKDLPFIKNNSFFKVIVETKQGLTAARWAGARKSTSQDLLIYVDDDNILSPDYLSTATQLFQQDSTIGMISGRILPEYEETPKEWFHRFEGMIAIKPYRYFEGCKLTKEPLYNDFFPIGAGLVIRKSIITEYYQSHLSEMNYIEGRKGSELSSGEDIDLGFYAISLGFAIGVYTSLKLLHIIPKERINNDYLKNLSVSSLQSSYLVNKKWKKVFGHNVFTFFNKTKLELYSRIVYYSILNRPEDQLTKTFYKKLLSFD